MNSYRMVYFFHFTEAIGKDAESYNSATYDETLHCYVCRGVKLKFVGNRIAYAEADEVKNGVVTSTFRGYYYNYGTTPKIEIPTD